MAYQQSHCVDQFLPDKIFNWCGNSFVSPSSLGLRNPQSRDWLSPEVLIACTERTSDMPTRWNRAIIYSRGLKSRLDINRWIGIKRPLFFTQNGTNPGEIMKVHDTVPGISYRRPYYQSVLCMSKFSFSACSAVTCNSIVAVFSYFGASRSRMISVT